MAYMRTRSKLEQAKKEGRSISSLTGSMRRSPHVTSSFSVPPVEYNAMYLEKGPSVLKTGCHYHGYRQH